MAMPQLDESKMKLVQELEIEMMTDMYAKLTAACHKKVNWQFKTVGPHCDLILLSALHRSIASQIFRKGKQFVLIDVWPSTLRSTKE